MRILFQVNHFTTGMSDMMSPGPKHSDAESKIEYENWLKKTSDSTFSIVLASVYAVLPDVAVDQVVWVVCKICFCFSSFILCSLNTF